MTVFSDAAATMKKRILWPLAWVVALAPATLAHAEGLPKLEWQLPNGAKFRIYGQIDTGVLVYDDGFDTDAYAPVDNENSSSRLGAPTIRISVPGRSAPPSRPSVRSIRPTA